MTVDDFLESCYGKGLNKPQNICDLALKEIEEIDEEIAKVQNLRLKRDILQSVLKMFNHNPVKKRGRKSRTPIVTFEVSESYSEYLDIFKDIFTCLSENQNVTPRILIEKTGFAEEDTAPFYSAIKWLLSNEIISRNEQTRNISVGPNWENRQAILEKNAINNN